MKSTLTHQEHTKVTKKSILEIEAEVEKLLAQKESDQISKEKKVPITERIISLQQKLKYSNMILENGNRTGKNGRPILSSGKDWEITLNEVL
jgi:anti-sigma factor ChrR (cupin superfamily)